MDETNNQIDPVDNNINDNSYIEDDDSDVEDDENYSSITLELNAEILQRLKQNDSGVTNINVLLTGGCFNTINWEEEADCIAKNTQLKKLRLTYDGSLGEEGHNLPTRKQLQGFFSCVYRNSSITALSFRSIIFANKFGGGLIEGLGGHPSIKRLEIDHGRLGSIGCEALVKVLKHQTSKLRDLRLFNCYLDDIGIGALCDGLLVESSLKRLHLIGSRRITSAGWRALSTFLRHPNCKLTALALNGNSINDEGADLLGSALHGSSLKILILSYNPCISSRGWQTLLDQLSQSSIRRLIIGNNKIGDNGLATLVNIGKLKSLDLQRNQSITSSGWRSLFNSLLTRQTQLVELNISGCRVEDLGAAALAGLLRSMLSLKTLNMSDMSYLDGELNNITTQGWQTLFTTLQGSNLELIDLNLNSNSIDDEGIQLLVRLVSGISSLKCLDLSGNYRVTPTGWLALSDYFRSPNFSLKTLVLDYNYINDDTVIAFTSALVDNKALKMLYLYQEDSNEDSSENNLITKRGWDAVSNLLCNKTSIMDTYNSNHTLEELTIFDDDEDYDYNEYTSYLKLNKNKDKVEVARQKILQTHFSSEDDTPEMQELIGMELEMAPTVIAWIGRPTPVDWKGNNVSGLSAMYNLTRRLPDVFDSSAHKKSSTAKRKREMSI